MPSSAPSYEVVVVEVHVGEATRSFSYQALAIDVSRESMRLVEVPVDHSFQPGVI
jgi:hypothetical protein